MSGTPEEATAAGAAERPPLKKKATHLSKEFVATVISLVTTAFGVVVALAWNEALTRLFQETISEPGRQVLALMLYALIVTGIGVAVIVALSRLAHRLDAEPVEFKYPVKPPAPPA